MAYTKKIKLRKLVTITTMIGEDQAKVLSEDATGKNTSTAKLIRDSIDQKYDIKLGDDGKE